MTSRNGTREGYRRGCIAWATRLLFFRSTTKRTTRFTRSYSRLVGYILSEDPTYITTYKGARSLIRKVDRDDLLQAMLRSYLNV